MIQWHTCPMPGNWHLYTPGLSLEIVRQTFQYYRSPELRSREPVYHGRVWSTLGSGKVSHPRHELVKDVLYYCANSSLEAARAELEEQMMRFL